MTQELRDRADLIMAWEAFEPGMEPPAPIDYEDTACKLMAAAAEIEQLWASNRRLENERNILNRAQNEDEAEIERLQAAKRAALAIADERSRENVALRAAATNLMAAIDNMHERGETFTARVSIAASDMRRALEQKEDGK